LANRPLLPLEAIGILRITEPVIPSSGTGEALALGHVEAARPPSEALVHVCYIGKTSVGGPTALALRRIAVRKNF